MSLLSSIIDDALPGWMREESRSQWVGLASTISLVTDALIDCLQDGRKAAMPGQTDAVGNLGGFLSIDALPAIGRDRRLPAGLTESPVSHAGRLRRYRQTWRASGTPRGILNQVRAHCLPSTPRLRLVTARGVWHTLESNGVYRIQKTTGRGLTYGFDANGKILIEADPSIAHPWDWDSTSPQWTVDLPPNPYRGCLIIYAPASAPLDGTEGTLGDLTTFYGDTGKTIGTTATRAYIDQLRGTLDAFLPGGITIEGIIIAFDPLSFNPLTPGPYPAPGMPDGTWHNAGKVVGGVRVPTRLASARYWKGPS